MFNIVQGQKKKGITETKRQNPGITWDQKKARYISHTLNEESIHNQQEGES